MMRRGWISCLFVLAGCTATAARTASTDNGNWFCPSSADAVPAGGAPSIDLYCIELIPTPAYMDVAWGVAQLTPPPTAFGAAVTRDGHHRFRTTFQIRGLPEPATLGAATYIAWAAPPGMSSLTKLGAVRNGRVSTGELALNKFYLLVSAEQSDTVTERRGPLLLRGLSASTRMRDPHFNMSAASPPVDDHAAHAGGGWTMPPHDARVSSSPMGIEHMVPPVTPFLPGDDGDVPAARPRELLRVRDGDSITLTAQRVRRRIKGRDVVMYGFNGQYPGPLIHVAQASRITVQFRNETPHETAMHWHGIRLDNRFDGVPHVTQEPVPPGGTYRYEIVFPDAGIYWYHPHHREDIQQDLGLYGNLMVASSDPAYYGAAHRDEVLMLDDILLTGAGLVPYGAEHANFAVMGRFGNVLLVNGEPRWSMDARAGEVVRMHLTNASNTRTFNISFDNARMKLVASDVGRFEREEWVESVVLAPAERYVVEVRFDAPGTATLTNRVQAIDHMMGAFVPMVDTLGTVSVSQQRAQPDLDGAFLTLRQNADVMNDVARHRRHFTRAADYELSLQLEQRLPSALTQLMKLDSLYFNPVEWAGTMPMMDWLPTTGQVRWVMRDVRSGAANDSISWRFRVGDVVRVRLGNERHSLHAMQHPIHIHGQRFMVLSVNGVPVENHVWKDTVLVPVGMSVEILLELTNPGRWMVHCHIAEHLEAGMQMVFDVSR